MRNELHIGDTRQWAKSLPPQSIQTIVTSPPYFGLRSYLAADHPDKGAEMGSEPTPAAFVAALVGLFRDLREALRDDGTLWLNLGPTYASGGSGPSPSHRVGHDPAYGSDGTGQPDYLASGSACLDLCDECRGVLSNRTTDTRRPHYIDASPPSPTSHDTGHRDFAEACQVASALGAPASTTIESSPPLPGACLHCANCGACLSVLRSASRDARLCARNSAYNGGTAATLVPSAVRTSDTESSSSAWFAPPIVQPYYTTFKAKDLIPIPWMVAMALQADGWYLRSDIIWHKPSPMPESVTDRPTRSHEHIFLLSKRATYYYDADAIREEAKYGRREWSHVDGNMRRAHNLVNAESKAGLPSATVKGGTPEAGRNARDVWTVASAAFPGSHFATFPPDLIRPCILAGTSERGACAACGAPWRRVVAREFVPQTDVSAERNAFRAKEQFNGKFTGMPRGTTATQTTGWCPSCQCCTTETRPCLVADPFMGSGTVAQVCVEEGRDWTGCDLDERARGWLRERLAPLPVARLPLGV